MTTDPLTRVLDAHGGFERWQQFTRVEATIVSGGLLFEMKGMPQDPTSRHMAAALQHEWSSVRPFGADDQRTDFTPDRVAIEKLDGTLVAERLRPRDSFDGHTLTTPWDPLQRAYFNGYALWTYLTSPFLLALPGMSVRAVDPATRAPLPSGEIGELAVRGYTTPGYFRAPELDAQAFDAAGWFLTGDLGSIEPDGRVRFRGRLKEMIKTGGVNVAPLEVEHVLLQHPGIVQAHVVGVPDRLKGEIVAAAVEMRADAEPDAAAITAFCRERLASYKVPARLAFRAAGDFPRTPTGKIHNPGLRDELARDGTS